MVHSSISSWTVHVSWGNARPIAAVCLSLLLSFGIWFGLPDLSVQARTAFITFGLTVIAWVLTDLDDTYVALTAAATFTLTGIDNPNEFFEALGDSTIWLLLSSFIIAAAVTSSGLSNRLTLLVIRRAKSVQHLFYLLTAILLLTAFVVPATSGRAALMMPVFMALAGSLGDKRSVKALALLFPTTILLSAVASLTGAGAHLVTADILKQMGGQHIGFADWALLGLPFALVSCFGSTWVILFFFLNSGERTRPLHLTAEQLKSIGNARQPLNSRERLLLFFLISLIALWATEQWHGIDNTFVALLGAILVTTPAVGFISFKDAIKKVEWNLLIFMAATLELGEALIDSGGAEWLITQSFAILQSGIAISPWTVTGVIAVVSLLSHLLINSRTARSSVLIPLVILLATSLGYNPTTLAFVSTAAAGFCLTLPVSAKPVAMFSKIEGPTYQPRDLLRLSSILLPYHLILLLGFTFLVWPMLGLSLDRTALSQPPAPPVWQDRFYADWEATTPNLPPSATSRVYMPVILGDGGEPGQEFAAPTCASLAAPQLNLPQAASQCFTPTTSLLVTPTPMPTDPTTATR